MINTEYTYEIQYDVCGDARREYDQWLSDQGVNWMAHPAVSSFHVQYNINGLSPEVKVVFAFSSMEQWMSFVTSEAHSTAKKTLRSVTTGLEGTLWKRGSIELDGTADRDRPNDEKINDASRR